MHNRNNAEQTPPTSCPTLIVLPYFKNEVRRYELEQNAGAPADHVHMLH